MLDNPLITLIISTIIAQESVVGIAGTPVKQAFQPTQQGINTAPTAYMYKVGDKRIGFPQRSDVWDPLKNTMVHTEKQVYETTFQISALSTQDPAMPEQLTASDIVNFIAYILQSESTVTSFIANDICILKVGDIRNPYFTDDRERNEAAPSFDFTITHKQIVTSQMGVVQSTEFRIATV